MCPPGYALREKEQTMGFRFPKTIRYWITLAVIAPTLTVFLLVSGIFQWSPLNCWHDEIDISTGRYP